MYEFTGIHDCKAGQRVKLKGKRGDHGTFVAHSITADDLADQAVIEDLIQSIEHEKNTLFILDHEIALPAAVKIKDFQRNVISLQALKAGDRVKLIGKYLDAKQFVLEKIKMKEPGGFNVAELQGAIDRIDREKKTLEVLGFTVEVNEKTAFYGG
jgi:hypothetical protein